MKKLAVVPLIMVAMLFIMGCDFDDPDHMTDPRDGQKYKFVVIGDQTWMAENLNYKTGNSWCYDNDSINCKIFGRLYDRETALSACPPGWSLPSREEWKQLLNFLGGEEVAGGKMKSTMIWNDPNKYATNESGWSGLPGGFFMKNRNRFSWVGKMGYWWSSTTIGMTAYGRNMHYDQGNVSTVMTETHEDAYSVRCLKD